MSNQRPGYGVHLYKRSSDLILHKVNEQKKN